MADAYLLHVNGREQSRVTGTLKEADTAFAELVTRAEDRILGPGRFELTLHVWSKTYYERIRRRVVIIP
jgi:hypothetical protein